MRQIQYFLAVFLISARRLLHQRGLALSMLAGLIAAVALTVSIPIYADSVSYRILNDRLYNDPDDPAPPFSFLFRYVGSWNGYIEWDETRRVDEYMQSWAAPTVGLPQELLVRHFKTDRMRLFPTSQASYDSVAEPLLYVSLGFISDLEPHIEILEGQFPRPLANLSEPIEVLISTKVVEELGFQPGEEYVVYYREPKEEGAVDTIFQHRVRIAGVWRAINPNEDYWFYRQPAFDEVFLMPEASYMQLASAMKGEVGLALWSLICDGTGVRSTDVGELLARISMVRKESGTQLRDIDLTRSPEDKLINYSRTVLLLTVSLYVFSVPILGLVFYFISLISGMIVQRQRNEVAMLRSRGTTTGQVIGIYVLEGLIVGVLSIAAGSLLGERLAQLMGLTRSFLTLEDRPYLVTVLSWANLRYGLLAFVASLLASIGPAINAARDTIVTYKQEQARVLRAPFWQRAFLDVLLLIPALYGYYLLDIRGTISFLETDSETGSPFSNPYLFLVPVIFVFSLSLMCIRVFPLVMRILAWMVNVWRGVVPVLALRHLSRTARYYTGPMLLLILTLSLAVFTASMAFTLDGYTVQRSYYDVGADFRLVEMGESTETSNAFAGFGQGGEASESEEEEEVGPEWLFLPVSEHLNIPGVREAARVWVKDVTAKLSGGNVQARLMGVDRIDFGRVGFFRNDFAPASLGALMNALAVRDDAVLVSRDVFAHGIEVGDRIPIYIPVGSAPTVDFTVGGVIDMFPFLYPEDGSFFVANLDFVYNNIGGVYPYDVWLRTDPSVTTDALVNNARDMGFNVMRAYDARKRVDDEQLSPERQGVFGLLSVGFVASAFLTVLGFLIYSYISFTQRFIELGVLRAIGLSVGQMAVFLIAEQLTLIATGALAGTGLGVVVSNLFIPFFQVRAGEHPFTPPFVVQIAWNEIAYIYAVFGAMFVAGVIVLLFSLRRMRIFEAVKLGETT
jgi:putative ABC transport system permease protein